MQKIKGQALRVKRLYEKLKQGRKTLEQVKKLEKQFGKEGKNADVFADLWGKLKLPKTAAAAQGKFRQGSLADGLGDSTRAAASSAVALGALRANRRARGPPPEALMVMHKTLRERPGPRAEMTALIVHWDPTSHRLTTFNCGHVAPLVIREDGEIERPGGGRSRGLGGRSTPAPVETATRLGTGERLVLISMA